MELGPIVVIIAVLIFIASLLAILAIAHLNQRRKFQVRDLVHNVLATTGAAAKAALRKRPTTTEEIDELKRRAKELRASQVTTVLFRPDLSVSEDMKLTSMKFFQAGLFTQSDRQAFERFQVLAPVISTLAVGLLMVALQPSLTITLVCILLALFIGIAIPRSWLERQIRFRNEEILYYLPLTMEQISIGVSSSLDIWPCISNIIQLARDRNSFNPVTELFIYVERLVSSGLNLQDALAEVARVSNVQQVKHTFQYLAQVAEHGGEISRQLHELANAVAVERQTQIEGAIAALPVRATGPLFLVFAGYFVLILSGIFSRLVSTLRMTG